MRLMPYSKLDPCYYCGAPPPSIREHVPPSMMFNGFDCDSITVPSCDRHNTSRSKGDRGIVTALIMSVSQMYKNRDKLHDNLNGILTPNIIRAIQLLEPDFNQATNEVELRDIFIDPPKDLDIPLPYMQPSAFIHGWIRQLTAALVWSVTGSYDPNTDWDNSVPWSHGYLPSSGEPRTFEDISNEMLKNQDIDQLFKQMKWHDGWSALPRKYPKDIYSFELSFIQNLEPWQGLNVVFRHRFYNSTSVWKILFKASQNILASLKQAIESQS